MAEQIKLDVEGAAADAAKPEIKTLAFWLGEIEAAEKREEDWRREGRRIAQIYEAQKKQEHQFNVLFSNTATMLPALYNATPRPVLKPRYKKQDPLAREAARIGRDLLTYLLDDQIPDGEGFDSSMQAATLAALVPGRGVTWFKYDPEVVELPSDGGETSNPQDNDSEAPAPDKPQAVEKKIKSEYICVEEVPWEDFRHGYAKTWAKVPWVGRVFHWTKRDAEAAVGAAKAAKLEYTDDYEEEDTDTTGKRAEKGKLKTARVYQIWDKHSRKVFLIAESYKDGPLDETEDPLGLLGFFPCQKPLQLIERLSNLIPVPLYSVYEEQARELNAITIRINKIVRALKVRGAYDGTLKELERVFKAEDNVLIAVQNTAQVRGPTGDFNLDRFIWLAPIEKLISVLEGLYRHRQECKSIIYEITGLSDIVRGASVATETATAQTIKDKWGGIRIKRPQKEVQRFVRDGLRIMLELGVTKLDPKQIKSITGSSLPTQEEKAKAQQTLQQAQQMVAPGAQPAPEQQQELEQLQQLLAAPAFEDALGLLQNDLDRQYRIDIETNSTVDAEATEDKQDIAELLNAIGQFLSGVGPLIENGTMPFEAGQAFLLDITRKYRLGDEVEDYIRQMKAPEQDEGEAQAAQLEMESKKMDMEAKKQQMAMDGQKMQMELAFQQKEHELKLKELAFKEQLAQAKFEREMQMLHMKAVMPPAAPAPSPESPGNTAQ